MTWRNCASAAGLAGCVLLLSGCGSEDANETGRPPEVETSTIQSEDRDAAIVTAVRARYFGDPLLKTQPIDVTSTGGRVTLTGTVESDAIRTQAATVAQQTEGVARVQNNLQVMQAQRAAPPAAGITADGSQVPPEGEINPPDPAAITQRIQAGYFAHPQVKRGRIDVTTLPGGVVTLEGQVETEQMRRDAIGIARSIDGVREVQDRLRVVTPTQAAAEIAGPAGPLPVSGTATQPGQPVDLERAPAATASTSAPPSGSLGADPARTTTRVESRFFLDRDLKGRQIEVTTDRNGVVTLRGEVASAAERRQAVAIARATEGVQQVRDELTVGAAPAAAAVAAPGTPPSPSAQSAAHQDEWITTQIRSTFYMDPDLKVQGIEVASEEGVVTLSGTAGSDDHRETAEAIARETDGVAEVINRIQVE